MIKVNGKEVGCERFPDGTINVKGDVSLSDSRVIISWHYADDAEFMGVAFLTKYYQAQGCQVALFLPYVPNARMDRVEEHGDIFSMKYFGELINSLNFTDVYIVDPHSSVAPAVIKNCSILNFETNIRDIVIKEIISQTGDMPILFYPDAGAMKRYSKDIPEGITHVAFGSKKRDWKTGNILGLDVFGVKPDEIKGKDVLIQDDICSKGGTFYYSALALKEMGARNIYLYVSHLENSVFFGEFTGQKKNLLETGLIEHIFTTNSIEHIELGDKISEYALFVWSKECVDIQGINLEDYHYPNDLLYRLSN